jgi:hypothetical protein
VLTAALGLPNKYRTAATVDCFDKAANVFGRYAGLLEELRREMLRSIFADWDDALDGRAREQVRGGDSRRGAARGAGRVLGDERETEVRELDVAFERNEHVLWRDIAVDEAQGAAGRVARPGQHGDEREVADGDERHDLERETPLGETPWPGRTTRVVDGHPGQFPGCGSVVLVVHPSLLADGRSRHPT